MELWISAVPDGAGRRSGGRRQPGRNGDGGGDICVVTQGCIHDILERSQTDIVANFVNTLDGDLAVGVEEAEGDVSLEEVAGESDVVGEGRRGVGGEGGEGGGGLVGEFIDEKKRQAEHSEDGVAEAGAL